MAVGWGRAGWGVGPWGEPHSVPITFSVSGVSATSAVGDETVIAKAIVSVTGVNAT